MPRVVSRAAYRLGIALGALALAALGLGWGWTSWRGRADLLARATSAYAQRDFRRAAELARRSVERGARGYRSLATCWLARRLGWVATPRPMPCSPGWGPWPCRPRTSTCWGSASTAPARRNRPGASGRRALPCEPDHAETIEQLIIRDTAQNRLAEAARLAERLARQPGWELRGELDLGTFRAEMSDPAGAAAVLQRALERPEASRLNRSTAIHYRELLARSLLKIERPREARDVLQKVLQDGQRPEASWLLSRAALQEGAIPEAVAALADRRLLPRGASSGSRAESCTSASPDVLQCHQDKVRAVQASRHNSTLVRGKPLAELPYPERKSSPTPTIPRSHMCSAARATRCISKPGLKDKILNAVVDYAFGSPRQLLFVGRARRPRESLHLPALPLPDRPRLGLGPDDRPFRRCPQGEQDFLGKPIDVLRWDLQMPVLPHDRPQGGPRSLGPGGG